jgi:hypothetical protein
LLELFEELALAGDDAGLRPAQKLVARDHHEVGAGADRRRGERLARNSGCGHVDEGAGAQILDHGNAAAPAELGELPDRDLFGEADDAVLEGWTLSNRAVAGPIALS